MGKTVKLDLMRGRKKPDEEEGLKTEMLDMTDKAKELVIKNQESFDITGQVLIDLASMKKKIVAYHKETKDSTKKAKDVAYQKEKDDLAPITSADVYVRRIRIDYNALQEKKRAKEQERLDGVARRRAGKEKEKLLAKAEKAEDPEEKEELQQKAEDVYVPANIAAETMEKTTTLEGGGSTIWVEDIEVEITDQMKLLTAIVAGQVPLTVLEIKPSKLKAWVKSNDIKNGQIQGIAIRKTRRESVKGM